MTVMKDFVMYSGYASDVCVTTEVKLLGGKKNPMVGNVVKMTKGKVRLGERGLYQKLMREKVDPNFVAGSGKRKGWGERIGDSCVIENNGKFYVELHWLEVESVEYFYNGQPIKKEDLVGLKEAPKPKGEEAGIVLRRVKMESVRLLNG